MSVQQLRTFDPFGLDIPALATTAADYTLILNHPKERNPTEISSQSFHDAAQSRIQPVQPSHDELGGRNHHTNPRKYRQQHRQNEASSCRIPLSVYLPPEEFLCQAPISAPLLLATQLCNLVKCAHFVDGLDALLGSATCSIGHSQGVTAACVAGAAEGEQTYWALSRYSSQDLLKTFLTTEACCKWNAGRKTNAMPAVSPLLCVHRSTYHCRPAATRFIHKRKKSFI